MKLKALVFRCVPAVEAQYGLSLHQVDEIKLEPGANPAVECVNYSREANDSGSKVEPNLFFLMTDPNGLPVAYGSPVKTKLAWRESGFVAEGVQT